MIAPALTLTAATAAAPAETFMATTHWELVARIAVAWGLTFMLGFERQLRGAMAGDRTFSMLGAATALIGALSDHGSTTILAGAVTGIGFIGGGLCFRQTVQDHEVLHGITTAASIFAAAAIGAACGLGLVKESIAATVFTLLTLELRHIPLLRTLDARRWDGLVHHDDHLAHHLFRRNGAARVEGNVDAPGEARVATPATADTDAVVLLNPVVDPAAGSGVDPVVIAQQAAAITAATVEPAAQDAVASAPGSKG